MSERKMKNLRRQYLYLKEYIRDRQAEEMGLISVPYGHGEEEGHPKSNWRNRFVF